MLGAMASARFSLDSGGSPDASLPDVVVTIAEDDHLRPAITDHTAPAEPEPVPMLTDTPGKPLPEVLVEPNSEQPAAKPRRQVIKKAPNPVSKSMLSPSTSRACIY